MMSQFPAGMGEYLLCLPEESTWVLFPELRAISKVNLILSLRKATLQSQGVIYLGFPPRPEVWWRHPPPQKDMGSFCSLLLSCLTDVVCSLQSLNRTPFFWRSCTFYFFIFIFMLLHPSCVLSFLKAPYALLFSTRAKLGLKGMATFTLFIPTHSPLLCLQPGQVQHEGPQS